MIVRKKKTYHGQYADHILFIWLTCIRNTGIGLLGFGLCIFDFESSIDNAILIV